MAEDIFGRLQSMLHTVTGFHPLHPLTSLNTDFQSVQPEVEMLDKAEMMAEHGGVSW